jgi:FkbM family methyltransferase
LATRGETSRLRPVLSAARRALRARTPAFPASAPPERIFRFRICDVSLAVPRAALQPELWRALTEGWYENDEVDQILAVLRPGDTVLELGAGIGFISTIIARQPGIARVVALEANPQLLPIAERTCLENGVRVELVNAAVAPLEGEIEFFLHPEFWASSTLPRPHSRPTRVPSRSLASLLAEIRPQVLVVDIEGGEASLFEAVSLEGVRMVVMELHPDVTGLEGVSRAFAAMGAAGLAYDPGPSRGQTVVFARSHR